ncbi:hypothetical protein PCANC_22499 [Puccinia coronata f. sp. avenae]|uniref:Uncharacterized protein n=1 Tax=Puccinia coronata f. sp. avenae TaxID=200324 RepID=A0A2N5U1W4_9BASI|nr:hypothetical protein PCANC_20930 [Puccinia coronata f. sp. avenae]PLW31725.1 hypothetical protein PCANC_22499 [Puccinia coronata f. sp. avenae]
MAAFPVSPCLTTEQLATAGLYAAYIHMFSHKPSSHQPAPYRASNRDGAYARNTIFDATAINGLAARVKTYMPALPLEPTGPGNQFSALAVQLSRETSCRALYKAPTARLGTYGSEKGRPSADVHCRCRRPKLKTNCKDEEK